MKILEAGHQYELDALDGGQPQTLTFVKRDGDGYPFNKGAHPGTIVQEVLRALIDRTRYLNGQVPCAETEAALGNLQTALLLFELRAARRHDRCLDVRSLLELPALPVCTNCGHIGCPGCGNPAKTS